VVPAEGADWAVRVIISDGTSYRVTSYRVTGSIISQLPVAGSEAVPYIIGIAYARKPPAAYYR
jgi:hypothetical protein